MIEIATPDGQTAKVKYTDQTQFRKDRQPAKLSDFKVGDMVAVRGEESGDHTIHATLIGARAGGPGGGAGGVMGSPIERRDFAAQGPREHYDGRHSGG